MINSNDKYTKLIHIVRKRRIAIGLTQAEIGKIINSSGYGKIEIQQKTMTVNDLILLANYFKLDLNRILLEDEEGNDGGN